MAQVQASKEYNTFVRGLITEANPLTFPENASLDEDNFILNRNGSRQRRLGVDYETNAALIDFGKTASEFETDAIAIHLWTNVNDDANISLAVVQVGLTLYFFDALSDPITDNQKNGSATIILEGDSTKPLQAAVVSGNFVIASGTKYVTVLKYNSSTDSVTTESHGLLVRDIWGVDDNLEIEERPGTLSQLHKYNLLNQGWGEDDPDSTTPYYETFFTGGSGGGGANKYPSNADQVALGIRASQDDQWAGIIAARKFIGSTPAPKGHFILDIFERSLSRSKSADSSKSLLTNFGLSSWGDGISGAISLLDTTSLPTFTGLPSDRSNSTVTSVASFAGRAFYSGMKSELIGGDSKSPTLGSYILFSQIVDSSNKIGLCFQEADPTSDQISDLISTDGGIIKIPEMSRCLRLVNIGRSLVVLAENGIWEISGGEENFSATSFQVSKISNIGAINTESIIDAEGVIYYWSEGGIYRLTSDPISLSISYENISETTIQTFFEDIESVSKLNAVGGYDPSSKKIQWCYSDDPNYDGVSEKFKFNRILNFDLTLEAFYPATISENLTDSPYIADLFSTSGFLTTLTPLNVVVGSDNVVTGVLNVVLTQTQVDKGNSRFKYLTVKPSSSGTYKFTISEFIDTTFVDWKTDDTIGTDAPAFLETGYEILQDTQRPKQATYLTTHFERTEDGFTSSGNDLFVTNPSSCLVQARWGFSDSTASGKFGTQFQAYRLRRNYLPQDTNDTFDYGYSVITTKSKIRGRGEALRLKFDTEAGKDLRLLGWGIPFTGNSNV